jgi:hypothetical protein
VHLVIAGDISSFLARQKVSLFTNNDEKARCKLEAIMSATRKAWAALRDPVAAGGRLMAGLRWIFRRQIKGDWHAMQEGHGRVRRLALDCVIRLRDVRRTFAGAVFKVTAKSVTRHLIAIGPEYRAR